MILPLGGDSRFKARGLVGCGGFVVFVTVPVEKGNQGDGGQGEGKDRGVGSSPRPFFQGVPRPWKVEEGEIQTKEDHLKT